MATSKAVETIFSANDKISPAFSKMRTSAQKFSVGAKAAIKSIMPQLKGLDGLTKKIAFGNLLATGIQAAGNQIKSMVASIPEFAGRADEISKTSQMLGMTTDALQRYRNVASLANVCQSTLNNSFGIMLKNISTPSFFTSLEKLDKGLSDQLRTARSSSEAFRMVAAATSQYTDASKKAAVMQQVFGRSGRQLIPMMDDLENQLRSADWNIIPSETIELTTKFRDTMTEISGRLQFFGDIIRSSVLQYIMPLIEQFKEWIAANREMIATKMEEFMAKVFSVAQDLFKAVQVGIGIIDKFGVVLLAGFAALKTWQIMSAVTGAISAFTAAQAAATAGTIADTTAKGAATAATGALSVATGILNAVMNANPIVLIMTLAAAVITLVIAGIKKLSEKVGGLGNALKVVGQTIMKYMLTPINLVISAVGGLLNVISKIPGCGAVKNAADSVKSFQNSMNTMLTGSESTLLNSGPGFIADPYRNARNAELERQAVASQATNGDPNEEVVDKLVDIATLLGEGNDIMEGLNENGSPTSPANLRWRAAGLEDYWGTVRAGI